MRAGRLYKHEEARNAGELVMLDTRAELDAFVSTHPCIFLSHQWLGGAASGPDPSNEHFPVMVRAILAVIARCGLDASKVHVWIDYSCVPQCSAELTRLSIRSLALYAASCAYFVSVAPPAVHHDTGAALDAATYRRRGWCRLECFARMVGGGLQGMYLWEAPEPAPAR